MTLIGHAALGATAYGALRPHTTTTRWGLSRRAILLCCVLLPMLPDADVGMHFWVKYGHPLGHRGVSHSLLFAVLVGLGLALLLQKLGRAERGRQALARMTLAFSLLMATHGITDAMTTGGKAPRVLWPVVAEGVWFPKQFIPVSPMGSSLLRTSWTNKQLAKMKRNRTKVMRRTARSQVLVREAVSWSKRPDHYRRLAVVGIAMTELALLAPLALVAGFLLAWRRRRFGPAAKEPPRSRAPPQAAPDGPPARLWPAAIALAVAFVAAVVTGVLVRAPDAGLSITSGQLDDDASTFYRRVAPAVVDADTPAAVLIHGYRCSHQMMMSLARMLARNGVEVWAVDMPGHGRSPIPLESHCVGKKPSCKVPGNRLFTDQTTAVVEHLLEFRGLDGRGVVVLGHSTGAVAAHDMHGPAADALAGRVVIEGNYRRLRRDGNRLIVGKRRYLQNHADGLELDVLHGDVHDHDAVELFTANKTHLSLIYDADVNARVLRWISQTTGATVGDAAEPYRDRHIAWTVAFALLGLALTTLGAAYACSRGWLPPVRPSGHARPGVATVCMIFGSIAAALWAGDLFFGGRPWLQMKMGQILPTYLICASVCIVIPYVALTRRPGRPQLRSIAVDAALAALVFITIYLTLGLATDRYLFHLGVPAWRWFRLLAWTAAFLPVSLVVHEVGFESERWWARVASVPVHGLIWAALFWVEAVGRSKPSLISDSMKMVAVLMFAEVWALCVGWRRRSRLFAALVSTLVLAWVLTAVYPILTGAP